MRPFPESGTNALTKPIVERVFAIPHPLQNHVPGEPHDRRRGRRKEVRRSAAVEKREEKRSPKRFSGTARGRCEAASSPSAPARKHPVTSVAG